MAEYIIDKIAYNGDVYKLQDNQSGYITGYTETDPVFSASAAAGISATDISNWNGKSSTDEKLKTAAITADSISRHFILDTDTNSATTKNRTTTALLYTLDSSTSTLILGNGYSSTAGQLRMYTGNNNVYSYVNLYAPRSQVNMVGIFLPSQTGTLALTSDIIDEKLAISLVPNSIIHYPILGNGTTAATRQYDTAFRYCAQSSSAELFLGNTTDKKGEFYFHNGSSYFIKLGPPNTITTNRYITLPDKTGTIALTSDVPSISLNGSSTTSASFYAPTTAGTSGQVLTSNGSGAPTWAAAPSGDGDIFIATYNSTTYADVLAAYNAGKTIICKEIFSAATTYYAYFEKYSGNTFYFATPGEDNNGSKAIFTYTLTSSNTWSEDSISLNMPLIYLNNYSTTSASFYAPTTAGTSGQVLTSNGSGAPTWAAAPSGSSTQIIRWTES